MSERNDNRKGALVAISALAAALTLAPISSAHAQAVNTTTLAAESKEKKDVDIEADQMQVLEDQKQAVFTGNVDAKRGAVTLKCTKLVVHYIEAKKQGGDEKTEVTHLDATGNVIIITKAQRITGNWAKMDVKANQVIVGGNVVVVQNKTVIKGKQLFVDLDKNISRFTGGRVKGSFTPGSN